MSALAEVHDRNRSVGFAFKQAEREGVSAAQLAQEALDRELTLPLNSGDIDALNERFTRIFTVYERPIFQHVFGMVGNTQTAEDLSQTAFTKSYQALPKFLLHNDGHLRPWLYRIATNVTLSHFRRQRLEKFVPITDVYPSTYEGPEEFSLRDATGQEILDATKSLSQVNRRAFMLREVHELPYNEVSVITGQLPNTAKTQANRARESVSTVLKSTV